MIFHHVDRAISSKPFVVLVSCDDVEAEIPKNVLTYFQTFSRFMDAPQVGMLVRNGAHLCGRGKDAENEEKTPKILKVYEAYEQAGRELATRGHIRRATQRQANQEIVPVPMFGLLKRFPFRFVKRKIIEHAREMQD